MVQQSWFWSFTVQRKCQLKQVSLKYKTCEIEISTANFNYNYSQTITHSSDIFSVSISVIVTVTSHAPSRVMRRCSGGSMSVVLAMFCTFNMNVTNVSACISNLSNFNVCKSLWFYHDVQTKRTIFLKGIITVDCKVLFNLKLIGSQHS